MSNHTEIKYINSILETNKKKSFVKRILKPENYPVLDVGNGNIATHKMAWGEQDGKYFVYPTVVMDSKNTLRQLSDDDAWDNAIKTKSYIEFKNPNEADWFSKNYKKVWDK